MSDTGKTQDEIRAAAWKLAALSGRGSAAGFLKEIAEEISGADWKPGGRGR